MGRPTRPRGSSSTGTLRLFLAFGSGLAGIVFLVLVLVPVFTGRLEFRATETDIDAIERDGFPDAGYLQVKGGNLVFELAHAWVSGTGDRRELFQLTVPVVGDRQLESWKQGLSTGAPIDLSGLRLVAVLRGEDVRERWPELAARAEAEQPLDADPVKMSLTGDTIVAKGQLRLPTFSGVRAGRANPVDWTKVRRLSHGVHFHSPGRLLKNLLVAVALLGLSFLIFRHHRRHPTEAPPGGPDLTPLTDGTLDL